SLAFAVRAARPLGACATPSRLEREAAGEDGQAAQHPTAILIEERVRPVERRAHRTMTRRRVSAAVDVERPLERQEQPLARARLELGGDELDREGQSIEPLADGAHDVEIRRARAGARPPPA